MRALVLPALILLAACGKSETPEEKALRDARDVLMVENAQRQHAPPQPIVLEAIPAKEQAMMPPEGKGCRFLLNEAPGGDPVALFGQVTGHIRVDGRVLSLAPDTGSSKVPGGAWTKYVGKTHLVRLTANAGGASWVEVVDPYDRRVYFAPGTLRCAAAAGEGAPSRR
jgi:hypothetical protein